MPTKVTLDLEGLEAYLEKLMEAGEDIDPIAEQALDKGADVFVAGMKRRAPYERIRVRIRKSKMGRDGNKRYVYVGVLRDTPAEEARLANAHEFGGPGKKNIRGRKHRRIVAHPYIRPALRQDAKKARAAMEDVFQDWLKK